MCEERWVNDVFLYGLCVKGGGLMMCFSMGCVVKSGGLMCVSLWVVW